MKTLSFVVTVVVPDNESVRNVTTAVRDRVNEDRHYHMGASKPVTVKRLYPRYPQSDGIFSTFPMRGRS